MARGPASESSVITIVATHVTTDDMHVVSGTEDEVLAELRRRFPAFAFSPDLSVMLTALGRDHYIARFAGKIQPYSRVTGRLESSGVIGEETGRKRASRQGIALAGVRTPTAAPTVDYPR